MHVTNSPNFSGRFVPNENFRKIFGYALQTEGKFDPFWNAIKKIQSREDNNVYSIEQFGVTKNGKKCFVDIIKIGYDNPEMAGSFVPAHKPGNRFTFTIENISDPLEHAYQVIRKISKNQKVYNRLANK